MLRSSKPVRKSKGQPKKTVVAKPAKREVPPENRRVQAMLRQWRQAPPASDEEVAAFEEALKSLDESRPHRPLFTELFS